MIERAQIKRRKIGQPAGDGSSGLGNLVGVGEVELGAVGDAGRAQSDLPSADERVLMVSGKKRLDSPMLS